MAGKRTIEESRFVYSVYDDGSYIGCANNETDARLLCAGPQMLEALEAARTALEQVPAEEVDGETFDLIEQAIQLARRGH